MTTPTDPEQQLAAAYRAGVEAGDVDSLMDLFHADVLVDTHVPNWRFQLQGRDDAADRACVLPRPGRFASFEVEGAERGLLVQFAWQQDHAAGAVTVRQLHAWHVVDGRIAEQVVFCAGAWDRQLQDLMAAKAPLVRP